MSDVVDFGTMRCEYVLPGITVFDPANDNLFTTYSTSAVVFTANYFFPLNAIGLKGTVVGWATLKITNAFGA